MKKLVAVFLLVSNSSTLFAANAELDNCASKAVQAATIFQDHIVSEMIVKNASISSMSKKDDTLVYSVFTVNHNGSRMRDTIVETDLYCNVQSVSRK